MQRDAHRVVLAVRRHRPLVPRLRAEVRRRIHEVLQVRRGEGRRVAGGEELGGNRPLGIGGVERHADRARLHPARPGEGCRDVEVRHAAIDPGIRAVATISKQRVRHVHGPVVSRHRPPVGIGARDGEDLSLGVGRLERVDVLRELVQRVAPRGRAAHAHLEGTGRHAGERRGDLGLVVRGVGKGYLVGDRRGRAAGGALRDEGGGKEKGKRGERRQAHGGTGGEAGSGRDEATRAARVGPAESTGVPRVGYREGRRPAGPDHDRAAAVEVLELRSARSTHASRPPSPARPARSRSRPGRRRC